MMVARPRILVTRSQHQASALVEQLRALGAEPIVIPAIELVEPTSFAALDEALARLQTFDWLLFTSVNAVEVFAGRAKGAVIAQKIAAIGPATARALEGIGRRVDLLPVQAVAESLAEALVPYARQADGSATRFLLVRAEVAREYLPEALQKAGGEVTIAAAYRTVVPAGSVEAVRELFRSRATWPDVVTFTSSSTAANLLALLEVAGIELPGEVLRVSIGPVTSATLRALGFPPHEEATAATIPELAAAVMRAVGPRHG